MKILTFRKTAAVLIAAAMFFWSCKDDENDKAPIIGMVHPVIHEHYMNGQAIPWQGTVTDNRLVTHVELAMWAEEDSTNLVFSVDLYPNLKSYMIDTLFIVDDTEITDYHFRIFAEDADGNRARNSPEDHVHINE